MVAPSCPALVVHDDDTFRKSLIAALDQRHFTVTFSADGADAVELVRTRNFRIVLLGVDLKSKRGLSALEALRDRDRKATSVIIVGEPDPELRTWGKVADETLLKPVDAAYVADRARVYCM
ncbi:MAG: Two-component system, OmpR family, response regulator TctD [Acidobacteria bacterium]|nr:Two-component system, OmpR family, response regulator TctD [Acidobacteriota bacterium]